MTPFLTIGIIYFVASFILGALWHVVFFPKYYKKLAIYSRIEKPRFIFGVLAMACQAVVFAYLFPLVADKTVFWIGMFLLLESFMVFAELGKQETTSVGGFLIIQTVFSLLQVALVALGVSLFL